MKIKDRQHFRLKLLLSAIGYLYAVNIQAAALPISPTARTSVIQPFVVGGQDVTSNQYQFIAAILNAHYTNPREATYCTGTLIKPDIVMTAAQCVSQLSPEEIDVVVGKIDLSTVVPSDRIPVLGVIVNPNYNSSNSDSDIALLKLSRSLNSTLSSLSSLDSINLLQYGDPVSFVGWGRNGANSPFTPNILQEATFEFIDRSSCISEISAWTAHEVTQNQFCAKNSTATQDVCYGDAGGPLMATIGGKYVQIGISSWGLSCINQQSVYTNLGMFTEWLASADKVLHVSDHFFGRIAINTSTTESVHVYNWTNSDLEIFSAKLVDESNFGIVGDNCSQTILPAGQSCELSIKFVAKTFGNFSSRLLVTTSSGLEVSTTMIGVGLANALVFSGVNSGNLDFYTSARSWYTAVYPFTALRNAALPPSTQSLLQTNVKGPGTLSFDIMLGAGQDDYLRLYIDRKEIKSYSGTFNWTNDSVTIDDNSVHKIDWTYHRGRSMFSAEYTAYLNNFVWDGGQATFDLSLPSDPPKTNPSAGSSSNEHPDSSGGSFDLVLLICAILIGIAKFRARVSSTQVY